MTLEQSNTPARKRFNVEEFGWSIFSMGGGVLMGVSLAHRADAALGDLVGNVLIFVGMIIVAIAERGQRKGPL